MLSNDSLLEVSLVVASLVVAVIAIVSELPTRRRVRRDMAILNTYGFTPFAVISLISLFLDSFLAIINSFLELDVFYLMESIILANCIVIFLPMTAYYCFILLRMAQPDA